MKLSRPALALALSASLLLSACSGSEDPDESTTTSPSSSADGTSATGEAVSATDGADSTGDTADTTGDAADATGDAADATGDAADTTADATSTGDAADATAGPGESADDGVITAPADGVGVISVEEAEEVANTLMRQAADSQNADPEEAAELNEATFSGSELRAAQAATSLREIGINPVIDYHPTGANVLAISREDGESPAYMVVQSVPESGLPELHLFVSEDDGETWTIGWSAPMLAGTEVPTFDPRSEGSQVLRGGKAGALNMEPTQAVDRLFEILDYPFDEDRPDFRTMGYGPEVRRAIEAQAAAVSEQATLTVEHDLRANTLRTIELADGSAITFPVLRRVSTFDVKSGTYLEAPPEFAHLSGKSTLNNRARTASDVFLAVHIKKDGDPVVIAAREQIVEASGS